MSGLYLLARIADEPVAIASDDVESVVKISDIVAAPQSHPSVAGVFALRSRVLTLVDCNYLVTGRRLELHPGSTAIIGQVCGHSYGFLVDGVDDVVSLEPENSGFDIVVSEPWQKFVRGFTVLEDQTVMIVDIAKLVRSEETAAA